MKTYNQLLTELFNKPVSYDKISDGYYEFEIGDMRYVVDILNYGAGSDDEYEVAFGSKEKAYPNDPWSVDITGTGNEIRVFATVIKIVKDFIKRKDPYSIRFTAKERSRVKLYRKMMKILGKGWDQDEIKMGPETKFYLTKL